MNHMVDVLTEHDKHQLLQNGTSQDVVKEKQIELEYEESIAIRDIKLAKEIRSRKILDIQLVLAFIPFSLANVGFLVPYKTENALLTGTCHFIMFMTYNILLVVFSISEYKLWTSLKKTNFLNGKINSCRLAAFFFFTNTYLAVHIWMMYHFSSEFIQQYIFREKQTTNVYT